MKPSKQANKQKSLDIKLQEGTERFQHTSEVQNFFFFCGKDWRRIPVSVTKAVAVIYNWQGLPEFCARQYNTLKKWFVQH